MFINPQNVITHLELLPKMKVADFGCGAGYYSILLAEIVGEEGKVFAFDIRKEMLETVRSQARLKNLLNIEAIWADLEVAGSTKLKDEMVDAVVISNILFQADNKKELIKEAHRITKKGGVVVTTEWDENAGFGGSRGENRITKTESKQIFEEAGFNLIKEFNAGDQHYGLLFKKQ